MQANHGTLLYAKVMLTIFIGLGVFSVVAMVRSFYRPLEATPEKLASTKKALLFSSWVMFAAVASAIEALVRGEYYLLGASAIVFSFVLPLWVHYFRLKAALNNR